MRSPSTSRAAGRTASAVTTRRERKARKFIVKSGPRENLVRMRGKRRLIASAFQVSKIDNSRRKKCCVAVCRAYTCRLPRAFGCLPSGIWRRRGRRLESRGTTESVAIRLEQSFHGTGDSAFDRERAFRTRRAVWRGDCAKWRDYRRRFKSSDLRQ